MSRFELYGGNECRKCKYFVRAADDKWETPRCLLPTNMYQNWLGVAFKRRPDDINWDRKCDHWKEKKKDGIKS